MHDDTGCQCDQDIPNDDKLQSSFQATNKDTYSHQHVKGIGRTRLASNRKHGSSLGQERGVEDAGLASLAVTAAHQYLIDPRMPLQARWNCVKR